MVSRPSRSHIKSNMAAIRPDEKKGWNDPPEFSYDAVRIASEGQTKNILNKRIAFPLSGNNLTPATSKVNQPLLLPPTTGCIKLSSSSHPSVPLPSNQSPHVPAEHIEASLEETLNNFKSILHQCENHLQKRNLEDVYRRLNCLEDLWRTNKLNDVIQVKVFQLSQALLLGKVEQANNFHLELIVNYPGVVSSWIVGIKHLIHHMKSLECSKGQNDLQDSSMT